MRILLFGKNKRHTIKDHLVNNKNCYIIHKLGLKKRRRHMIIYSIYKSNHPITPKDVVNVHNLGYLGIEKDFPVEQLSFTTV